MRVLRRSVLRSLAHAPLLSVACATGNGQTPTTDAGAIVPDDGGGLTVTPACQDGAAATRPQTEGPYWTPSSPQRASLREAGQRGTLLVLEGFVVSRTCQPVARALVDLWHCDDAGEYDNKGFTFRGHVFTGDDGRYRFETIVPGLYPGRTRHFHVKVQQPGRPVLTTQLYFPGEAGNTRDGIFHPELVMKIADGPTGKVAGFTFVLA